VLATSRTPYHAKAAEIGVTFYEDPNDFCEEHPEVVVLASSILSLDHVLAALPVQRLRRNTLFVDVLSVKQFPKHLLLSRLPPEVGPLPPTAASLLWLPPVVDSGYIFLEGCRCGGRGQPAA
jgi:prephenate dehydrogenase